MKKFWNKIEVRRHIPKVVVFALSLVCAGTLTNVPVFADSQVETWEELKDALREPEGTIPLTKDINAAETLEVSGDRILDLNGHTINGKINTDTSVGCVIRISVNSMLTLADKTGTGKITGGNASYGGGVYVDAGSTFIMQGGNISGNSASYGGGVYVDAGSTFIMQGGVISANNVSSYGGGVYSKNGSSFTMEGGTITGNTSDQHGGGVYNSGSFIMLDGTISDNKAGSIYNGGGVYNGQGDASFEMKSGTITGNSSESGGGVYNYGENINFSMSGYGVISNNKAETGAGVYFESTNKDGSGTFTVSENSQITGNIGSYGGGVYINNGLFTMDGGIISGNAVSKHGGGVCVSEKGNFTLCGTAKITGNTAGADSDDYGGGVYLNDNSGDNSGTFTLGGAAIITGNVKGGTIVDGVLSGGTTQNVYLKNKMKITLDKPNAGMSVGVSSSRMTMHPSYVFTSNNAEGCISYFSSDNASYKVVYDSENKLQLKRRVSYKVTIDSNITNGVVAINPTSSTVLEGETVTVTATPSLGYILKSLTYNDGTDHDITDTKSFTMPESAVTVKAIFEKVKYDITVIDDGNGSVAASVDGAAVVKAEENATVTLEATPVIGYKFGTLSITDKNDKKVDVSPVTGATNKYEFVMPASEVTILATFEKREPDPTPTPTPTPDPKPLPFKDVLKGKWYYDAIDFVYQNGIMVGKSADIFDPTADITRQEFVTILYNYMGKPEVSGEFKKFKDVPANAWFAKPVQWGYENRVLNGKNDKEFGLGDVTRQEAAKFMYNFAVSRKITLDKKADLATFKDAGKIGKWAKDSVSCMVGHEVMKGKGNGKFDPAAKLTRAEAAQLIKNFIETFGKDS